MAKKGEYRQLVATVLPTGALTFEFEPCDIGPSSDRSMVEKQLEGIYSLSPEKAMLMLGLVDHSIRFSQSIEFLREISGWYVHELLTNPQLEELREEAMPSYGEQDVYRWRKRVPPMVGAEIINADFIFGIIGMVRKAYEREVGKRDEPVEQILRAISPGAGFLADRVHFHLVENRKDEEHPFAFMATYSTRQGADDIISHLPLGNALKEFSSDAKKLVSLLSSIKTAGAKSPLIHSLLESGEIFHPLGFTASNAHDFLLEVPLYEDCGILCRIPKWWNQTPRRLSVGLIIGDTGRGKLTADSILRMKPCINIDGEPISESEANEIISLYNGLALIKGKWTVVNRVELDKRMELFREANSLALDLKIGFVEATRMLAGLQKPEIGGVEWDGELAPGAWMEKLLGKLKNPAKPASVASPRGLRATLRPYQKVGLTWLNFLHEMGLGACLADDMGLGKTLQVLALLQLRKTKDASFGTSLLIVPSSLIDNWRSEAKKFTPELRVAVAHTAYVGKEGMKRFSEHGVGNFDLVVTTYAMARRLEWIAEHTWHYLILDEAQAIKNAAAAQTRAIKSIPAEHRIALTGTPIENRLGDLWSLFDFTNKGLLGSAKSFQSFAKSLNDRPEGFSRLREAIQPYILRRLKTDKSIISDLPEKIEMKAWATLSKKQIVLYENLVDSLSAMLASADGIKRKGLILAYLTKLKQVCNHPDHYAGSGEFREADSGKFQRLREICDEILEKRERVLVFTQFREMVDPLDRFLSNLFKRGGVYLHGGTSLSGRKEAVAAFQDENHYVPYFVLSVKAGGVGLNLTAANHVIHFDRWWNPAVERQAEDRAFRIGQKRTVVVHRFVGKGTIEEKIDNLIDEKRELSEKVLAGGNESWITELSDEKIKDMFRLGFQEN